MTDTLRCFENAARAAWAISLREFRRMYGDRRLGLFWAFAEPLGYIVVFSIVLSSLRQSTSPIGGLIAPFLAEGLFAFMLFNNVEATVSGGIAGNRALLSFPRVKPFSIFVGRTIAEAGTIFVVFGIIYGTFILVGWTGFPDQPYRLVAPVIIAITIGFSLGIINAVFEELYPAWGSIYKTASRMNFFLAGVFFVADSMPPDVRSILYYTPIIHITEWVRSACHPDYESRFLDENYVTWFALTLLFASLLIERVFRRRVLSRT